MKDIYELFNEVDIDFSDVDDIEVNELERERGKKKLMNSIKKKRLGKKKIIAAASLAIAVMTSITVIKPTWAQNLPVVGSLIQKTFEDSDPKYENYVNVIGQTNSYNGIDITFENAMADKNSLFLNFVVKDNNKTIENYVDVLSPMIMKVNGEEVNMSGGADGEKIDDNTVRILRRVDWNFDKLPKKLDIELLNDDQNLDIKFSMDTKEIESSTKAQTLNKIVNVADKEGKIEDITISPIMTKVEFYLKQSDSDGYYSFLLFDQNNNNLKGEGGQSTTEGSKGYVPGRIDYSTKYVSTNNMTKITFIPIKYRHNENPKVLDSKMININNFEPISFKITDNISLEVESLERDEDKIIIKYNYYYKGKKISRINGGNLFIKSDKRTEGNDESLDEYVDESCDTVIYRIGQEEEIEIGCYDSISKSIFEDQAFTVDVE